MFKIGDTVKINFEASSMIKLDKEVLINIKKWDKQFYGVHKITDECTSGLWTDHATKRYELDNNYMFFTDEIYKINEEI